MSNYTILLKDHNSSITIFTVQQGEKMHTNHLCTESELDRLN